MTDQSDLTKEASRMTQEAFDRLRTSVHRFQNHKQYDGAKCRHDDVTERTVGCNTEETEDESADHRADDTDDDVTDEPEACAFHEKIGKPARNEPDEEKPDDIHGEGGREMRYSL